MSRHPFSGPTTRINPLAWSLRALAINELMSPVWQDLTVTVDGQVCQGLTASGDGSGVGRWWQRVCLCSHARVFMCVCVCRCVCGGGYVLARRAAAVCSFKHARLLTNLNWTLGRTCPWDTTHLPPSASRPAVSSEEVTKLHVRAWSPLACNASCCTSALTTFHTNCSTWFGIVYLWLFLGVCSAAGDH